MRDACHFKYYEETSNSEEYEVGRSGFVIKTAVCSKQKFFRTLFRIYRNVVNI